MKKIQINQRSQRNGAKSRSSYWCRSFITLFAILLITTSAIAQELPEWEEIPVIDWTRSSAVKTNDWNKLKVEKSDNEYKFYINDVNVDRADFEPLWGFAVHIESQNARVMIDDIVIKQGERGKSGADRIYSYDMSDRYNNKWTELDNKNEYRKLENGRLIIEDKTKKGRIFFIDDLKDWEADFSIELKVKKVSGPDDGAYGIYWGRGKGDSKSAYWFQINGKGEYRFIKKRDPYQNVGLVKVTKYGTNISKWISSDYQVFFSDNEIKLLNKKAGSLSTIDPTTGMILTTLVLEKTPQVKRMGFDKTKVTENGKYLCVSSPIGAKAFVIYHINTGRIEKIIPQKEFHRKAQPDEEYFRVSDFTISSDLKYLAFTYCREKKKRFGDDYYITTFYLVDVKSNKIIKTTTVKEIITGVDLMFNQSNTYLSYSSGRTHQGYLDVENWEIQSYHYTVHGEISSFSNQYKAAWVDRGKIYIYDIKTGASELLLDLADIYLRKIAVSYDESTIAVNQRERKSNSIDDKQTNIILLDSKSGKQINRTDIWTQNNTPFELSHDGTRLLFYDTDYQLSIFDSKIESITTISPKRGKTNIAATLSCSGSLGDGIIKIGKPGNLNVTYTNHGISPESFFPVAKEPSGSVTVGTVSDSVTLEPGQSKTVTFSLSVPDTLITGNYALYAGYELDKVDTTREYKKNNSGDYGFEYNYELKTVFYRLGGYWPLIAKGVFDFAVTDFSIIDQSGNGQIEPLENVEVTVKFKNIGSIPAQNVTVWTAVGENITMQEATNYWNNSSPRKVARKFNFQSVSAGEENVVIFTILANSQATSVPVTINIRNEMGQLNKSIILPFSKDIKQSIQVSLAENIPTKVVTDRTPPVIRITQPAVQRGMKKKVRSRLYTIRGQATDNNGAIREVLINNKQAQFIDAQGGFELTLNLKDGDNRIHVRAVDMSNNTKDEFFDLILDEDKSEFVKGKYYALIIGINNYSGDWTPLSNAVHDASAIEEVLRSKYQFNTIRTLYDEKASRTNIITELEWLINNVKEQDNVLIYYSGHGELNKKQNRGFWVPVDATNSRTTAGYVSNSDIQEMISGISSKHTLLISDACFAGDIFRGKTESLPFENSDRYYKEVYRRKSRQALASGGLEPVMDGGKDNHSIFTYYLLKKLRENDKELMDSGEIFNEIRISISNNSDQTPMFQPIKDTGDEGGQFIFIKSKKE